MMGMYCMPCEVMPRMQNAGDCMIKEAFRLKDPLKDPQVRAYVPFVGPFDPCKPLGIRTYLVPPQLFIPFQPMGWPQYSPAEALRLGTLWPALYSPYTSKKTKERAVVNDGEGTAESL